MFSEEQKKEEFLTRRQYFFVVHKLFVSWIFLYFSIALFIVCKIKIVLHLFTCNKLRYYV